MFSFHYLEYFFSGILVICLGIQCLEDIRHHLLYDEVSMLLGLGGFARSYFFGFPRESLAGAGLCFLILAGFSLYKKGGMGLGDLLLGTSLGFWLNPEMGAMMLVGAFVLAAVYALLLCGIHGLRDGGIAFAPFLSLATLAVYFYGNRLLDLYLRVF